MTGPFTGHLINRRICQKFFPSGGGPDSVRGTKGFCRIVKSPLNAGPWPTTCHHMMLTTYLGRQKGAVLPLVSSLSVCNMLLRYRQARSFMAILII